MLVPMIARRKSNKLCIACGNWYCLSRGYYFCSSCYPKVGCRACKKALVVKDNYCQDCLPKPESDPPDPPSKSKKAPKPDKVFRQLVQERTRELTADMDKVCADCGSRRKIGFHHTEYSYRNPLIGRFLCWACHRKVHYQTPHYLITHHYDAPESGS